MVPTDAFTVFVGVEQPGARGDTVQGWHSAV